MQQSPQVADQYQKENDAAGNVDGQNNILQAVEVVGALNGLGQQKQRDQNQRDAGCAHQR